MSISTIFIILGISMLVFLPFVILFSTPIKNRLKDMDVNKKNDKRK